MMSSITTVVALLALLALLPMGIKWIQRRVGGNAAVAARVSSVVSAVAVGPQQRVVTVEVGPRGDRTWLVLGVTAQSITLLHSLTGLPDAVPADSSQGT
jgi:flagellar protein FliO/FliZ